MFNLLRFLSWLPCQREHELPSLRRTRLLVEVLEDRTVPSVCVGPKGTILHMVHPNITGHTINVAQTATQNQFTVRVDAVGGILGGVGQALHADVNLTFQKIEL